jgi:predicted small secreted protein
MKKSFIITLACIACILAACGNNTNSGNGTDSSIVNPSKDTTFLNDTNRTLDTGNRKMDSLKAKAVDSAKRNPI